MFAQNLKNLLLAENSVKLCIDKEYINYALAEKNTKTVQLCIKIKAALGSLNWEATVRSVPNRISESLRSFSS